MTKVTTDQEPREHGGERGAERRAPAHSPDDAIEMLEAQHRALEALFRVITERSPEKELWRTFSKLARMLLLHDAIETRHLYPAVRAASPDRAADVLRYLDQHRDIKRVLGLLFDAKPSDQDLVPEMEQLEGLVEEHVIEEERELFPRVRALMSHEQLVAMAQDMAATMAELQAHGDLHASGLGQADQPTSA